MNDDIKNILGTLKKERRLITAVTLITLGWGVIYVATAYTPKYESKARLWIKAVNQEMRVNPMVDAANVNSLMPVAQAGNPILTQMEILKSSQISQELTAFINKNYPKENPSGKLIDVNKHLELKNRVGTDIIEVNFTWSDPKLAQLFLKRALDTYQGIVTETNTEVRKKRREFIDNKIVEIEKSLDKVNNQIEAYKKSNNVMTLNLEAESMASRRGELETMLAKVMMEKRGAQDKANDLRRQLGMKPNTLQKTIVSFDNSSLVALENNLSTATLDYLDKKEILSEENPKLIAAKAKVDYLTNQINKLNGQAAKSGMPTISDPVKANIAQQMAESQSDYMGLAAQERSLRAALGQISSDYQKLPQAENSLTRLEGMRLVLQEAYKSLKTQQIDAHMNEAEVISNIFPVDQPSFEEDPTPLTQTHYLILALLAGLGLGVLAALARQQFRDSVDRVPEIEEITDKPVIGKLPWFKQHSRLLDPTALDPSYNQIIANLRVQSKERKLQTLVFTSPMSTTIREQSFVYGIAKQLASLDYRVAVVDNDFRHPMLMPKLTGDKSKTLSQVLKQIEKGKGHALNGNGNGNGNGKSNGNGSVKVVNYPELTARLSEAEETEKQKAATLLGIATKAPVAGAAMLQHVEQFAEQVSANLHVYGNLDATQDPYKYFDSAAYQMFIEQLKAEYDWVIVDAPIDYSAPEFPIIAGQSDGVVLMVNYQVKKSRLKEIMSLLEEWNVNLVGSIVREDFSIDKDRFANEQ